MLEIVDKTGDPNLATVYIARTAAGKYIEFVESIQPPLSRKDKWVLMVSILYGCPVGCMMCDAGGNYQGKLSKEEILAQIDFLIISRFPNRVVDCDKFKIQFARMGEPALNKAVLDVLNELPDHYRYKQLIPSISTVAPCGCDSFFEELLNLKNNLYADGNFQMQFSIHTTDQKMREKIIPIKKWNFSQIASYGEKFYANGDRKITLNFAYAKNTQLCPDELKKYFDPDIFIIKLTPVNPTINATTNRVESYFTTGAEGEDGAKLVQQLKQASYEVILSIGALAENEIGSNCGQYLRKFFASLI